jgi:hypothetical protein
MMRRRECKYPRNWFKDEDRWLDIDRINNKKE